MAYKVITAAAALALASCGGSSGGSPAPTPTPTPIPTPTPTVAATSTARVYATSAAIGKIDFTTGDLETFGLFHAVGFTDLDGRYFPGYANAFVSYANIGTAPGASLQADYALTFKRAQVFDRETGMQFTLFAPSNVRMVTPVTSLLAVPGTSADKVKTQFGITNSLFAMVTDPDLATYDAIAEVQSGNAARGADAARMFAANLRVTAVLAALKEVYTRATVNSVQGPLLQFGDFNNGPPPAEATGARCLAAAPAQFIFQNDRMSAIIQCFVDTSGMHPTVRPSTLKIQAIAHLIDGYAAAMPVRLETGPEGVRWLLGVNGYLRAKIGQILADNTDATAQAVLAITAISPTILDATARYGSHHSYGTFSTYWPQPDFVTLTNVSSLTINDEQLLRNDVVFSNVLVNSSGIDPAAGTIDGFTIAANNAVEISVVRNGPGVFTVTALNGFKGASFFDYYSSAGNSFQRITRVYVRVL